MTRVEVRELLTRIAEDRGLTFEPAPANVINALPELQRTVDDLAGRVDERRDRTRPAPRPRQ